MALKEVTGDLAMISAERSNYTGPSNAAEKEDFTKVVGELKTILSKLPDPERAKSLSLIDEIAAAFK